MVVLNVVLLALAQVGGGMLAAGILGAVSWNLLKILRHPEYGPTLSAAALATALLAGVPTHHFLGLAAIFLLVGAAIAWPEGSKWRERYPSRSRTT